MNSTVYDKIYDIYNEQRLTLGNDSVFESIEIDDEAIFIKSAVMWSFWAPDDAWYVTVMVDLHTRTVYQVDIIEYDSNSHRRWVAREFFVEYTEHLIDNLIDATEDDAGIPIRLYYGIRDNPDEFDIDVVKCIRNTVYRSKALEKSSEDFEIVEINLTDSELACIARAAHMQDITINEFINNAIKDELNENYDLTEL